MSYPEWIPSKEELEKVEQLAFQGLTQEQIGDCLGRHASTMTKKKHECIELDQALKRGKARGLEHVTQALLSNVNLGNVTAQIFYLKVQGGWKEPKEDMNADAKSLLQNVIDKL